MNASDSGGALYVDTSAIARVLLGAPDTDLIVAEVSRYPTVVASRLMRTELRRVAMRMDLASEADSLLEPISLIPLTPAILQAAESVHPATVATLDAIHLSTALEAHRNADVAALMTFDRRLAEGARRNGLPVSAPGA